MPDEKKKKLTKKERQQAKMDYNLKKTQYKQDKKAIKNAGKNSRTVATSEAKATEAANLKGAKDDKTKRATAVISAARSKEKNINVRGDRRVVGNNSSTNSSKTTITSNSNNTNKSKSTSTSSASSSKQSQNQKQKQNSSSNSSSSPKSGPKPAPRPAPKPTPKPTKPTPKPPKPAPSSGMHGENDPKYKLRRVMKKAKFGKIVGKDKLISGKSLRRRHVR